MGRRGGGGGGGRSMARPPARSGSNSKPANTSAPAPVPAKNGSGETVLGTFASNLAEGLSWGAGHAFAQRIVDGILGPRTIQIQEVTAAPAATASTSTSMAGSDACGVQAKAFQDCMDSNISDISRCQFYVDMLSECKRNSNSGSMMSF